MKTVDLPSFKECSDAYNDELAPSEFILKPDPLTSLIYENDTVVKESSEKLKDDLKALVEWCINNPEEVISKYG